MILRLRKDRDFRIVGLAGGGAKRGGCPYAMFDPCGGLRYGNGIAALIGSMYGGMYDEGGWVGGTAEP
jgi:hypothetical protein